MDYLGGENKKLHLKSALQCGECSALMLVFSLVVRASAKIWAARSVTGFFYFCLHPSWYIYR